MLGSVTFLIGFVAGSFCAILYLLAFSKLKSLLMQTVKITIRVNSQLVNESDGLHGYRLVPWRDGIFTCPRLFLTSKLKVEPWLSRL